MPVVSGFTDGHGPVLGAPANDIGDVDKLDFMNLLVAQIQNQDPMSPMDNAAFTEQLTQFSMLDEMQAIGSKLDDSMLMSQSLNNTAMLGLVGKKVTVAGDHIWIENGEVSPAAIDTSGTGTATVEVKDETGLVVASYSRQITPGLTDISWDGKDADGELLDDGEYTFDVTLVNPEGVNLDATSLMTGPVNSLRYENNIAVVSVADAEYYVAEIYQVSL